MKLEFDPKTGKVTLCGREIREGTRLIVTMDEKSYPYRRRYSCWLAYNKEQGRYFFKMGGMEHPKVDNVFECDVECET